MPVVSSKINQQELDAVAEYANRHGITISNLIRMLLVREIAAPRILAESQNKVSDVDDLHETFEERPRKKTLMEMLADSRRQPSRLERIMEARRQRGD